MKHTHRFSRVLFALAWACLSLARISAHGATDAPRLESFGAEGGDFRATLSTGQVLKGADLVGATINMGVKDWRPLNVRIDTAERDTQSQAPDVWLFGLSVVQPDGSTQPFCHPDPDGRNLVIPYPTPGIGQGFALTCSSGAVGKCFRFGYRPWADAALARLHAACVRMVRADYGGDDRPWTRNGMKIDVYDDRGIQRPEEAQKLPFEAGWTPEGAVCVAHPRVPANGSLAAIVEAEPRLAGRIGPEACTEEKARALGAVVFNRSAED